MQKFLPSTYKELNSRLKNFSGKRKLPTIPQSKIQNVVNLYSSNKTSDFLYNVPSISNDQSTVFSSCDKVFEDLDDQDSLVIENISTTSFPSPVSTSHHSLKGFHQNDDVCTLTNKFPTEKKANLKLRSDSKNVQMPRHNFRSTLSHHLFKVFSCCISNQCIVVGDKELSLVRYLGNIRTILSSGKGSTDMAVEKIRKKEAVVFDESMLAMLDKEHFTLSTYPQQATNNADQLLWKLWFRYRRIVFCESSNVSKKLLAFVYRHKGPLKSVHLRCHVIEFGSSRSSKSMEQKLLKKKQISLEAHKQKIRDRFQNQDNSMQIDRTEATLKNDNSVMTGKLLSIPENSQA